MGKLRVLIVDDSAVVRESLARMINSHPDMEVMDVASNPYIAAKKIQMEIPDVITLDVEMPKMDGITFLRKIMLQHPIPVIIISSLTEKGTHSAIKALEYGAVDVLPKPDLFNETAINRSQDYLCEIIKGASSAKLQKIELNRICKKRNIENTPKRITSKSLIKTSEKVIAIGASTGGTEVIKEILQSMPVDCPGIIIVQHMPELFTRSFARRLDEICEITVKEAENNDKVQRGKALIAPGNRHIELKRNGARYYVELSDAPLVNRHRPSVDVLFFSVATYAGSNAVGVILTGMGSDGASGLLEMKSQGAYTIAQDESSCIVFGMPKEAIKIQAVNETCTLEKMASRILALSQEQMKQ